jgi:Na+-driven multidrug efflux pump
VGRLGTASLGAVGLSTLLFVFSNLFFNFLTVVTTSNVAGAYAVSDEQEVRASTMAIGALPLHLTNSTL